MNIAVIGLGSMGRRRIRILQNSRPADIIIGVDSQGDRTQAISEEYGVVCYGSMEEIAKEANIQCAFVCTSPLSHAQIITDCLTRGWHVFTEINLVSDGYEENIQLAKNKNLTLFLSSTPIYRPEMQSIRQFLQGNLPFHYIYHVGQYLPDWHPWEDFNNFFVKDKRTNGCRELFAIELPWISKVFGTIREVQAAGNNIMQLSLPYQDSYFVRLLHENGTSGILAVDVVCRQAVRHLELYNEQFYIEWNGTPETLKYKNLDSGQMEVLKSKAEYAREQGYSEFVNEYAYVNEIEEFFEVLQTGKEMQYSFEEDKEILHLVDMIEGKA